MSHPFQPGVVQSRGDSFFSRCRVCKGAGKRMVRQRKDKGVTVYWQHARLPDVEPEPQDSCQWQGAGHIWCCKEAGHGGSHHAHRGPKRDVH